MLVRILRTHLAASTLIAMAGCAEGEPTLEGEWLGLLRCGEADTTIDIELHASGERFLGSGSGQFGSGNDLEWAQIEVTVDTTVQPATLAQQAITTDCDAPVVSSVHDCWPYDLQHLGNWVWDGADVIQVSGDCSGTIDRL